MNRLPPCVTFVAGRYTPIHCHCPRGCVKFDTTGGGPSLLDRILPCDLGNLRRDRILLYDLGNQPRGGERNRPLCSRCGLRAARFHKLHLPLAPRIGSPPIATVKPLSRPRGCCSLPPIAPCPGFDADRCLGSLYAPRFPGQTAILSLTLYCYDRGDNSSGPRHRASARPASKGRAGKSGTGGRHKLQLLFFQGVQYNILLALFALRRGLLFCISNKQ